MMQKLTKVEIKWLAEDLATRISLAVQELKTTIWRGKMATFEDTGQYYASNEMMQQNILMSISSGLIYDTEDVRNVKIIKKATPEFIEIVRADIRNDASCFYGWASTYTHEDRLSWEF
jgi:hypothetical protein